MEINELMGISGRQNLEVLKNGQVVRETGFHKNMVLNNHFDRMAAGTTGTVSNNQGCKVGTGVTAVNETQTDLINTIGFKAGADSSVSTYEGVVSGNHVYKFRRVFTFVEGAVVGNVSEVGTQISSGAPVIGTSLSTRALVVDPSNNPTSIAVQAAEQLRVTHDLFLHVPVARQTLNFAVTTGGNTTNHVAEWESVNKSSINKLDVLLCTGSTFRPTNPTSGVQALAQSIAFNVTQDNPSVITTSGGAVATAPVRPTPLIFEMTSTFSATAGNIAGGAGGALMGASTGPSSMFALTFTPPIPKTSLNKLTITVRYTFVRV